MDSVQEGQVLAGKYRVERVLGQGGMGIVVAAMHQQLNQRVALKFLLPEVEDQESRTRFLREARAAVRLKSEHVARVLDVGTLDAGSPYIVMEFLEGCDLAEVLATRERLPLEDAVEYTLQACEALAEAHAQGIVHRDLKPGNLFLTTRPDGSPCVKVLDFGISKMSTPDSMPAVTQNAVLLGTPGYMSPEQLRSSRDVDARSDVWAVGVIFYELLTGHPPFRAETLPELCTAILVDSPVPLREHLPEISPEIEAVIGRALEKNRDVRYQSLAAFAQDLAPYWSGGTVAARKIAQILGLFSIPSPVPSPVLPPVPSSVVHQETRVGLPSLQATLAVPPGTGATRPGAPGDLPTSVAEAPAPESELPSSSSNSFITSSSLQLPVGALFPPSGWKMLAAGLLGAGALVLALLTRSSGVAPAEAPSPGIPLPSSQPIVSAQAWSPPLLPSSSASAEVLPELPKPSAMTGKKEVVLTPSPPLAERKRNPPVNPGKTPGLTSDFGSRK